MPLSVLTNLELSKKSYNRGNFGLRDERQAEVYLA